MLATMRHDFNSSFINHHSSLHSRWDHSLKLRFDRVATARRSDTSMRANGSVDPARDFNSSFSIHNSSLHSPSLPLASNDLFGATPKDPFNGHTPFPMIIANIKDLSILPVVPRAPGSRIHPGQ